jgi:ABC-2 type transport system permease protein
VRAYHADLRAFYYPLLFRDEPYDPALLAGLPVFSPEAKQHGG